MNKVTDTLILHIGLPKTGTTVLQKRCFDKFDNTVTGNSTEEWKLNISKGFYRLFQHDPLVWRTEQGQKYIKLLKYACSRTSGKPLFISRNIIWPDYFPIKKGQSVSEPQQSFFLVSLHLEALLENCPWLTKIKVIVTLRNQPQWLASLYAQQSPFISYPSNEDFERQVRLLMQDKSLSGGGFLNWGKLIEDLVHAVGKNNVYILLLEEIEKNSYWKTLFEASELPFDPEDFVSISNKPLNVLNTGFQEWSIQNREASFNIEKYDSHIWNIVKWPLYKDPHFYNAAIYIAEHFVQAIRIAGNAIKPVIRLYDNLRWRKDEFCLSDELASDIKEYCHPFNQKLAEYLGRDLSELGY